MPPRITRFEQTPNPHALRCELHPPAAPAHAHAEHPHAPPPGVVPGSGSRSFRTPEQARGDTLAAAIMAIPGVAGLLIAPDGTWMTVNKRPDADWKALKPALERTLAAQP